MMKFVSCFHESDSTCVLRSAPMLPTEGQEVDVPTRPENPLRMLSRRVTTLPLSGTFSGPMDLGALSPLTAPVPHLLGGSYKLQLQRSASMWLPLGPMDVKTASELPAPGFAFPLAQYELDAPVEDEATLFEQDDYNALYHTLLALQVPAMHPDLHTRSGLTIEPMGPYSSPGSAASSCLSFSPESCAGGFELGSVGSGASSGVSTPECRRSRESSLVS